MVIHAGGYEATRQDNRRTCGTMQIWNEQLEFLGKDGPRAFHGSGVLQADRGNEGRRFLLMNLSSHSCPLLSRSPEEATQNASRDTRQ